MIYKGIEYSVEEAAEPGSWKWQFRIGGQVKTGVTATRLFLLASRRAQLKINQALSAQPPASS
ncbi:MAG: hypothetical protein Q7U92_23255 [Bradyrhizobium sp.]|nr:hypothetical protein [Bradyrhizobium sp.]